MSKTELTELLGGWEGYEIGSLWRDGNATGAHLWIELLPVESWVPRCGGCGRWVRAIHETTVRTVRDLPILDATTWLRVHRRRVWCDHCGPKLERLSWLPPYARVTRRLAESVARLCQVLPIKHVATHYGLSWDQVKAIDKAYLTERLGPVDLRSVKVIGMDEFAIHKGQRYATVVIEAPTARVLWVGGGRSREDIRPFFELLGDEGRQRLRAVVMDMDAAFEREVRHQCPNAEIVFDLFHVVAKYGREVIDRVRVDEANRLRHDKKARRVVKGSRWLLLRNRENTSREERIRLEELLSANRALMTVYVLKDDLKHLWHYKYPGAALRF